MILRDEETGEVLHRGKVLLSASHGWVKLMYINKKNGAVGLTAAKEKSLLPLGKILICNPGMICAHFTL